MAREDLHFRLRLPEELKRKIEVSAKDQHRSMTAEMISRLEASFTDWVITLPPDLAARVEAGTPVMRNVAAERVQMMAVLTLENYYPPDRPLVSPEAFYQAGVDALPKTLPDAQRAQLLDDLLELARKIAGDQKWTPPDPNVPF